MRKLTWEEVQQSPYRHRQVFAGFYGPFPHPCHFCGETVKPWAGRIDRNAPVIHHLDHDQTNNDPKNLVPAHHGCHMRYHMTGNQHNAGRTVPPEERVKISATLKGRVFSAEHRAKLSAANARTFSPEQRANLSAKLKGRKRGKR